MEITEFPPQRRTIVCCHIDDETQTKLIYLPKTIFIKLTRKSGLFPKMLLLYEYNNKWFSMHKILPNIEPDSLVCMDTPSVNNFWRTSFSFSRYLRWRDEQWLPNNWWEESNHTSLKEVIEALLRDRLENYENISSLILKLLEKTGYEDDIILRTIEILSHRLGYKGPKYEEIKIIFEEILKINKDKNKYFFEQQYMYAILSKVEVAIDLFEKYNFTIKDPLLYVIISNWEEKFDYYLEQCKDVEDVIEKCIKQRDINAINGNCFCKLLKHSKDLKRHLKSACKYDRIHIARYLVDKMNVDPKIKIYWANTNTKKYLKTLNPNPIQRLIKWMKS